MNIDAYLHSISSLMETGQLSEEVKLHYFESGVLLPEHLISFEDCKIYEAIVRFELDDGRGFLVKDKPLHFFLAYGLILEAGTEFFLCKEKGKGELIMKEETFKILDTLYPGRFEKKGVLAAEDLKGKNFEYPYERVKMIHDLGVYCNQMKHFKMWKFHFCTCSGGLFLPTVYEDHFDEAQRMTLPVVSLLDKEKIRSSDISFFSEGELLGALKPFCLFKSTVRCPLHLKKKTPLFLDVGRHLYFSLNPSHMFSLVLHADRTNVEKDTLIQLLRQMNGVRVSSNSGTLPLVLYKNYSRGTSYSPSSQQDFLERSGRDFQLEASFLSSLQIIMEGGTKGEYQHLFLRNDFLGAVEKMQDEYTASFEHPYELILGLTACKEVRNILHVETLDQKQLEEFFSTLLLLLEAFIKECILENKIPKQHDFTSPLEVYFVSLYASLFKSFREFENFPSRKHLLEVLSATVQRAAKVLSHYLLRPNELYFVGAFLVQCFLMAKNLDTEKTHSLTERFGDLFNASHFILARFSLAQDIENLIDDCIFAEEMSSQKSVKILVKQRFDFSLVSEASLLLKVPPSHDFFIRPNSKRIKKIFPFSAREVEAQLLQQKLYFGKDLYVLINGRETKVPPGCYDVERVFKTYRVLRNNPFMEVLVQ
ncbi:MAG: hypothetical protein KC548_00260 [Nanoarchaeota archaeon]|nr:hypothetical protein [Nanoarchaeota archaeon]